MIANEQCPATPGSRISAPSLFVFGVWIVMLCGALNFLARYAVNVPYAEDGMLIPYVTGSEPFSWNFFWCQYSNHVIPLPKIVLILTARLTHDFRTAMYLSVVMCSIAAIILTYAAKTIRGHIRYQDAFFSIGLLHLGHWECYLLGFAIQEVMATILLALLLFIILRSKESLSLTQFLSFCFCLFLLPLTGGSGCLISPILVSWLAYITWLDWRSDRFSLSTIFVLRMALMILAMTTLLPYLLEPPQGVSWQGSPTRGEQIVRIVSVYLQVLTLGFGTSASTNWMPFLNQFRACYLVGSFVLGLAILGVIVFAIQGRSEDRLRKTGVILYLVANLLVIAGISTGRSAASETIGMSPRYSLYSVPILWALYFGWELYGPSLTRQLVPIALFAFMCSMTSLNMNIGIACGESRKIGLKALEHDILQTEVPPIDVATTHGRFVSSGHWVYYKIRKNGGTQNMHFANMVQMLREANIPRRKPALPSP